MKKMKIILLGSAVVMSMALGLQARVSGFLETGEAIELDDVTATVIPNRNDIAPNSPVMEVAKKSIVLETGIEMRYREVGNPDGRTMLFLHGYTDTSRSFENLMKALLITNPDLRLIAPDLRGHGESSMPPMGSPNAFTMEHFAEDILNFMALKHIAKVDLIGHSMGSVIAQEIALQHPEKLVSLTMIGAFVDGKNNDAIQNFLIPELLQKWQRQLAQRFGDDWRTISYTMTPKDLGEEVTDFLWDNWVTETQGDRSLLKAIYLETIEIPLGTWFGALEALAEMDNSKRLDQLKTPTLIIWGTGDELILREDQDRLLEACENGNKKHGTRVYHRSYNGNGPKKSRPGHNLHWGDAKNIASDILGFTSLEVLSAP